MDVSCEVYELTKKYPSDEKYGLISQVRRSAVSIASNIAEGAARNSNKEFLNFLYIARGSLSELDTQLELSRKLNYINQVLWEKIDFKLIELDRLLSGLIKSKKKAL